MHKDLLPYLRTTLVAVRHRSADASQTDIALAEGVAPSQISLFERGQTGGSGWPRNPDARVAAYAAVCGTTSQEIWQEVFRRYEAAAARSLPASSRRLSA